MSDDQFTKLFTYMEEKFSNVDKRFDEVDRKFDQLQTTVDAYAKKGRYVFSRNGGNGAVIIGLIG